MTAPSITDEVVCAAVRDSAARAQLLEAAVSQIRGMVLARLAAEPDRWNAAEDIVQEVLVALDQGLARLQIVSAVGYFGFQSAIVTHKVQDHFRVQRAPRGGPAAGPLRPDASSVGPLLMALSATGPTPSSIAIRNETAIAVVDELGGMPANHREVITLAVFDHLGTREIGERLGISRTSAANLLTRALDRLRCRFAARLARQRSA